MIELLGSDDLPTGFEYPRRFLRVVELGLTNLEPWSVVGGEVLWQIDRGLKERYPLRTLVPFARRQDCDDVACFEPTMDTEVAIVHDFASPGWEDRGRFTTFDDWLRQAIEDLIDFQ